jgi:type II secretory ATPase GspE/PulE/Tfp pilus assembly ATPase PilB-like protein
LTGHLVFSTLHTNDAASAVTRLLDLGIEPYLLASSLVGVLAQRLVRRVCPDCGRPHEASAEDRHWLGIPSRTRIESMRDGTGCDACRNTGYRGRLGIFELLVINNAVRRLVQSRATAADLKTTATGAGMQTLRDDGIRKVLAGLTTITEVERVTMRATGSEDAIDEVEPETPLGASPDVLPQVGLLEKP